MPDNKRRSFLKKTALTAVTGALLGKTALSMTESKKEEKDIIKIRPLGFQWETKDPFLFCVHHEDKYPKGNDVMGPAESLNGRNLGSDFNIKDGYRMYHGETVPGFPGHPHRGFETITVVREGMVDHSDSLGASGRYGNGDVQWMTAGKGINHAEMFPLLSKEKENPMELFQIWLNLPAKSKFVAPHFKMLWHEDIPKFDIKDNNSINTHIEVLAGSLNDKSAPSSPPNSWAADNANEIGVWNIKIDANGSYTLPKASKGINRTLYFYKGDNLTINNTSIKHYHAADVVSDRELTLIAGDNEVKILVLQGRPINEPVVQHGPFVMNTRAEINQAFEDYQKDQFGGWPWPKYDVVHDRKLGRFAKHADGKHEVKG